MMCLCQDNFYNHCLSESARRDTERDTHRVSFPSLPFYLAVPTWLTLNLLIQGVFTGHARLSSTQVPASLQQVKEYGAAFSERMYTIVHQLAGHSDLDVRFLGYEDVVF